MYIDREGGFMRGYEETFKGLKNYEFEHGIEYRENGEIITDGDGLFYFWGDDEHEMFL